MLIIIPSVRYRHISWDSPSGVILLGGEGSGITKTTEKMQENGTTSYSFNLERISM